MTRLESQSVEIAHSAETVFSFLSDFNNFQKLMPEQVTNWKSSPTECEFTINGMATIGMRIEETQSPNLIRIVENGKVPFTFKLEVLLQPTNAEKCHAKLVFEAELNAMMKMMLEKPLGNFVQLLATKLQTIPL